MRRSGGCFAAVAIAAFGCTPAKVNSTTGGEVVPAKAPDEPGFVSLLKGPDSRLYHLAVGEVIRDSSRWHAVWGVISRVNLAPPAPYVDFEREMLVLVAGPTGGPGDSVVIERVTESSRGLRVWVTAYQQCSPLILVKAPYHVVRVRRSPRKPVFENRLVRGPQCMPADTNRKISRFPAAEVVPAEAPDSVPAWVRADSNFTGPSAHIPIKFRNNILVVHFRREATQAQRQFAIHLISGVVVGGSNGGTGNGMYLVRVADPGDGSVLVRASEHLKRLPYVSAASPDIEFGPQ